MIRRNFLVFLSTIPFFKGGINIHNVIEHSFKREDVRKQFYKNTPTGNCIFYSFSKNNAYIIPLTPKDEIIDDIKTIKDSIGNNGTIHIFTCKDFNEVGILGVSN